MPIYKSKLAEVNVPVAEDEVVCDWSAFTSTSGTPGGDPGINMRGSILQELIYIIYRWRHKTTDPSSPPNLSKFPNGNLYDYPITSGTFDNIFKKIIQTNALGAPVNSSGSDIFLLPSEEPTGVTDYLPKLLTTLPDLRIFIKPDNIGYVVEACMIYSMYYHIRILAKITGYQLNVTSITRDDIFYLNTGSQADSDKIDGATWGETASPDFYVKLKDILLNKSGELGLTGGIKEPTSHDYPGEPWTWEKFVEIFDPKVRFGDTGLSINVPAFGSRVKNTLLNFTIESTPPMGGGNLNIWFDLINRRLNEVKINQILKEAKCLFTALLGKDHEFNASFIATGDGTETVGVFGTKCLGVFLFNYNVNVIDGKPSSINIQQKYSVSNSGSLIHFSGFGFDQFDDIKLKFYLSAAGSTQFAFFKNDFSTQEWLAKPTVGIELDSASAPIYKFKKSANLIAEYNSTTRNIRFNITHEDTLCIEMNSPGTSVIAEGLLLYSVINPKVEIFSASASNYFDDDKFEVKENVLNTILSSESDVLWLRKIGQVLLSSTNPAQFEIPLLYGNFVGKPSSTHGNNLPDVIPDPDYYPFSSPPHSETGEGIDLHPEFIPLRYSFAKIILDYSEDPTKVKIEINSFVSPTWSRLDKEFDPSATGTEFPREWYNAPPITPAQIASYTVSGYEVKPGVASYNQALCMLRSMGLLEAILYRLYIENGSNSNLLTIINSFLQDGNTVAKDKTIEVRPGLSSLMQLTNTITYDFYKRAKWYKKSVSHDDKNLYLTFPF